MELKIIRTLLNYHRKNLFNTELGNGRTSADCFDCGCIVIGGWCNLTFSASQGMTYYVKFIIL